MDNIIDIPKTLYKFRTWDKNTQGKEYRTIENKEIYFSSPSLFNDPFDCRISIDFNGSYKEMYDYLQKNENGFGDKQHRINLRERCKKMRNSIQDPEYRVEFERGILRDISKNFGIFSLSACKDNILLWSHYSTSHKGFCVGFSTDIIIEHLKKNGIFNKSKFCPFKLLPVQYRELYPNLKIFDTTRHPIDLLNDSLTIKSVDWEYEQEFRLIVNGRINFSIVFPENSIESVYFGVNMPLIHRKEIMKAFHAWQHKPAIFEAKQKKEAFGLDFEQISL